jgi:wyosine [tRNA(Phe)-imidazoG37] synthetase (radical SAM superfamily)
MLQKVSIPIIDGVLYIVVSLFPFSKSYSLYHRLSYFFGIRLSVCVYLSPRVARCLMQAACVYGCAHDVTCNKAGKVANSARPSAASQKKVV